jgi:transglutaminase-like putative cysteine protease
MHFAIRFLTEYHYDAAVTDNLNALRVRPATTSTQRCDEFHTRIEPEARVSRHLDYFGTEVIEFGIPTSHEHLTIDVRARVVTSDPPEPPRPPGRASRAPPTRGRRRVRCCRGRTSRRSTALDELERDWARTARSRRVELFCELIPDRFEYRPGSRTSARRSAICSQAGAGVCQDFVHLALILLRRTGSPPATSPATCGRRPRTTGRTRSRWTPTPGSRRCCPAAGGRGEPVWVGADPTNRRLAGETHVKIGHGRFYADVPPVKGVYMGGASSELNSAVTMSRLDPQGPKSNGISVHALG